MSDLVATFSGFARDVEDLAQILTDDLERLRVQKNLAHERLGQDDDMERKHGTVWGSIQTAVELAQKRELESVLTSLKIQDSNIDYFTKTMDSKVQTYINSIRELTYTFSQLRQNIELL